MTQYGEGIEMTMNAPELSAIIPPYKLKNLVKTWFEEDCPSLDYGSLVLGSKTGVAQLLCKSPCVLAGLPFFNAVFEESCCTVTWKFKEGHVFEAGDGDRMERVQVATVAGEVVNILRGERLALNALSRASGVASVCRNFVRKAALAGWTGRVAGTRKTTPGFRIVEKYASLVGGADPHRYDLSSMVMLKDNHIWCTGSIKEAVRQVLDVCSWTVKVEVECQNLEEALEAAEAGAHTVMFDNFKPENLHPAARELKQRFANVTVECSGGITEQNVTQYFGENVDIISTSALVQGYPCADFSLKIIKDSIKHTT